MAMNKVVKRRGKREGPTSRIWVTFTQATYEALSKRSKKIGYTLGALTRQTIDRAVACGLLLDDLPSLRGEDVVSADLMEQYVELATKTRRSDGERIRLLTEALDLKQQLIELMEQRTEKYKETTLRQAVEIAIYETGGFTDGPED